MVENLLRNIWVLTFYVTLETPRCALSCLLLSLVISTLLLFITVSCQAPLFLRFFIFLLIWRPLDWQLVCFFCFWNIGLPFLGDLERCTFLFATNSRRYDWRQGPLFCSGYRSSLVVRWTFGLSQSEVRLIGCWRNGYSSKVG